MAEHVLFEQSGTLSVEGEEGRRYFAARAGRWRIVPSTASWTLLLREGRAPAIVAPPPRAALAGDLASVHPGDIATFIHQGRRTGVLLASSDGTDRTIYLREGKLCWAASTSAAERLGEVAVRLGLLRRAQLDALLSEAGAHTKRLGQLLIDRGLMNGHDLFRAIQHQVQEIFFGLLVATNGAFVLLDDPVQGRFAAHIALDVQGLLIDGVRRLDEMALFRGKVPSSRGLPKRTARALPEELEAHEPEVAALCDGQRTIADIGAELSLGEFDVTRAIFHLLQAHAVELSKEAPPPPPPEEPVDEPVLAPAAGPTKSPRDIARAVDAAVKLISRTVSGTASGQRYVGAVDAFLLHEGMRRPVFKGLSLSLDGGVDVQQLAANLGGGPDAFSWPDEHVEGELHELIRFAMFQAGELVGSNREAELEKQVAEALAPLG